MHAHFIASLSGICCQTTLASVVSGNVLNVAVLGSVALRGRYCLMHTCERMCKEQQGCPSKCSRSSQNSSSVLLS
jgi:hypothetical protein